jgi:hypothetical protein
VAQINQILANKSKGANESKRDSDIAAVRNNGALTDEEKETQIQAIVGSYKEKNSYKFTLKNLYSGWSPTTGELAGASIENDNCRTMNGEQVCGKRLIFNSFGQFVSAMATGLQRKDLEVVE